MMPGRAARALVALALLVLSAGLVAAAFPLAERAPRPHLTAGDGVAPLVTPRLWIRVEPGRRSVAPGSAARYHVRIHHRGDGPVWLRVTRGLPRGATASIHPRRTRGSHTTLIIRTTEDTPTRTYRPRLRARGGVRHANVVTRLIVGPPQTHNFQIAGTLSQALGPGITAPLDLRLTNPDPEDILITDLGVRISQITAPQADETHPCSADDFSVTQFSGEYPFALAAGETRSLSETGFAAGEWPQITMLDRPLNQDGCQGALLAFEYTGTSRGGAS
jgi:hypothetical protein